MATLRTIKRERTAFPCPVCESTDTKSERKTAMRNDEVGPWLKRSYLCQTCGERWNTGEMLLPKD